MRSLPLSPASPLAAPAWHPLTRSAVSRIAVDAPAVGAPARAWFTLAVGSLVIAGLLSLSVVVGRLPLVSRIVDDPLFFKRCLVVHVDLALVVWFYAFMAGLLSLGSRATPLNRVAFALSTGGVLAMLTGALQRGAAPILANYVPVIAHPVFLIGLALFCAGVLLAFVDALGGALAPARRFLPADAALGLKAAAVLGLIAAATWVSARAGLPAGVDPHTRAEFLAWGPGHVLQAANTAAMLGVWMWLIGHATGARVLSPRAALLVFAALVLPPGAMPLLTARGTLDTLYHTGATQLMRWAIFPTVLVVFGRCLAHLWRHRRALAGSPAGALALTGFAGSGGLALLGMLMGACIRGSTTLVPAHYHASLGAVTLAFMAAAYLVCALARSGGDARPAPGSVRPAGRRQLAVFGVGQTVFALGFAIGGACGLGRKAYAAEQQVRNTGEIAGLVIMGAGGLAAAAGGLWFLFLVLREIRRWWSRPGATVSPALPPSS